MEQNPGAKRLPVILPAVLYHGKRAWNAPRSFAEMVEAGEGLEQYIPDFAYDLYNLGEYEDERLLLGDAMALGVVLYLMKHIFDEGYGENFVRAAKCLGAVDDEIMVSSTFLSTQQGLSLRFLALLSIKLSPVSTFDVQQFLMH